MILPEYINTLHACRILGIPYHAIVDAERGKAPLSELHDNIISSYLKYTSSELKKSCKSTDVDILKRSLNSGRYHVKILGQLNKQDYDRLNNWQHGKTKQISPEFISGVKKKILSNL